MYLKKFIRYCISFSSWLHFHVRMFTICLIWHISFNKTTYHSSNGWGLRWWLVTRQTLSTLSIYLSTFMNWHYPYILLFFLIDTIHNPSISMTRPYPYLSIFYVTVLIYPSIFMRRSYLYRAVRCYRASKGSVVNFTAYQNFIELI
jgi:hypothetical protein